MSVLAHAKATVLRSWSTFVACLAVAVATGAGVPAASAAAADATDAVAAKAPVVAVLRPRHIAASTAAQLIRPVLSDQAQVALDDRTASLVVSDLAENMEKARQVLATVEEAVEARDAAGKAASQPAAAAPADAMNAEVAPDDPELKRILKGHGTYQAYAQALDEMALDLATAPLGPQHPKRKAVQAKMEALRAQLEDVREEIRMQLAADRAAAARVGAGAAGIGVTRAAEVVTRQLKLPRGAGLVVERVAPGSGAEAAALMPYDVLVRLDGQLLVNGEQLDLLLASLEPGKDVQVELFRDGELLKRTMKLPATAQTKPAR